MSKSNEEKFQKWWRLPSIPSPSGFSENRLHTPASWATWDRKDAAKLAFLAGIESQREEIERLSSEVTSWKNSTTGVSQKLLEADDRIDYLEKGCANIQTVCAKKAREIEELRKDLEWALTQVIGLFDQQRTPSRHDKASALQIRAKHNLDKEMKG